MEFRMIAIDKIRPNPFQPRESFDKEALKELANSMNDASLVQPIVARRYKDGFQIIAGERRWRAASMAGLKELPVLVKDVAEEDVLIQSLVENLHRQNLESIEEEKAVFQLWESGRWKTYSELGKALGKSEAYVTSHIQAKRIRDECVHAHPTISTRTIHDVAGLDKEERETVLDKIEKGEIKTPEVRDYTRVIKAAPEKIKKEVLRPQSRITPKMAETIITKLSLEEEQQTVVDEIKRNRLTEDEVEDRVREIKRAKELGMSFKKEMGVQEGTIYTVGEYECPHCKKHYLIKCDGKRDWVE